MCRRAVKPKRRGYDVSIYVYNVIRGIVFLFVSVNSEMIYVLAAKTQFIYTYIYIYHV